MEYTAIYTKLTPEDGGGYMGTVEQMPEVITQGETIEEVRANVIDAIKLVLEDNRERVNSRMIPGETIREQVAI